MKQFLVLLRKDLLELVRKKIILIVGVVFVIFALVSPLLAKITPELLGMLGENVQITMPEATIADSYGQLVKNFSQMCVYALIIAFAGLIVRERKSGMYNNLLNNGVRRSNFVLSKITAQFLVVTGIYAVSCLLFCVYNYALFGEFWVQGSLLSFLAMYVFLIFVIGFINLFSVVSKSMMMSVILGFLMTIFIALFDLFEFGKYLPNHLIGISIMAVSNVEMAGYAWQNMAITLGLFVIIVFASVKLCSNKE